MRPIPIPVEVAVSYVPHYLGYRHLDSVLIRGCPEALWNEGPELRLNPNGFARSLIPSALPLKIWVPLRAVLSREDDDNIPGSTFPRSY